MIEKIEYYSTGKTSKEGHILWGRHPSPEDIVEKINEIIEYLNRGGEDGSFN